MGFDLYNNLAYGAIIHVPKWMEHENLPEELCVVSFGNNFSGEELGDAICIEETYEYWDSNEPIFLKKVPVVDEDTLKLWDNLIKKWCDENNFDFEPPTWMIMNWLG